MKRSLRQFLYLASAAMVVNEIWRDPGPALTGIALIAAGIPVYLLARRQD